MARTSHGILSARYNTASSLTSNTGGTELADIDASRSSITFRLPDGTPVDPHGNKYPEVVYADVEIWFRGLSAYSTLKTTYEAGTKVYWGFLLSNNQWAYTTAPMRISELLPDAIQGQVQGDSTFFRVMFSVPLSSTSGFTT